ncbi:hypothetical protein K402DRAFT_226533 [Aulographum hederae CBS 113979]|uniref:Uncharacterized protein n=1 Tax=Aulographum hederae CBS 113979 TaxID=1176131 RepID=A0A6G1HB79_9PEZI|nr:hypothetical protein K402DRAFT_226533 [Aulographum hederae CBS 113979]
MISCWLCRMRRVFVVYLTTVSFHASVNVLFHGRNRTSADKLCWVDHRTSSSLCFERLAIRGSLQGKGKGLSGDGSLLGTIATCTSSCGFSKNLRSLLHLREHVA